MKHSRLEVICVHVRADRSGIQRIEVRCTRCGESLAILRNGFFERHTPCSGDGHVIPAMVYEPEEVTGPFGVGHGGPRAVEDDFDKTNSLLNRMAI